MEELKTYLEWEEIICAERNVIVYDPDAYRMICDLGKQNELMTREEAESYFGYNTLMTYDFEQDYCYFGIDLAKDELR